MAKAMPQDCLFSEEHEWIKIKGQDAMMGITDHAQASLGDVVYVELPKVGQEITRGKPIGIVESVKAVSDIFAPISGVVKEVNKSLVDHPEKINQDPYGDGWLLLITAANTADVNMLLNPGAYQQLLEQEAKI